MSPLKCSYDLNKRKTRNKTEVGIRDLVTTVKKGPVPISANIPDVIKTNVIKTKWIRTYFDNSEMASNEPKSSIFIKNCKKWLWNLDETSLCHPWIINIVLAEVPLSYLSVRSDRLSLLSSPRFKEDPIEINIS